MQPVTGFWGQFEVLNALILREIKTRFGAHQLGYLWALIEPVLWISTFMAMFYFLDRGAPNGMDTASFIATGLVPFVLFRETVGRSVAAISANKGLLFYPQIQPLDLVLARALLEAATLFIVFMVLIALAAGVRGVTPDVADWLTFLLAFGAAAALGASLGLCFMAGAVFFPAIERLLGPMLRPLFWISGVFFTANGLPPVARQVLMFNPVLHIIEFVRTGWFVEYQEEHASAGYVLSWIVSLGFLGLVLERLARRRLEVA